jgi:Alw26I/Eco31I/Esp3I family type II restriction m6 adenine DNA methyltransferase
MDHLNVTNELLASTPEAQRWIEKRAAGRFYTARLIGDHLIRALKADVAHGFSVRPKVRVVDPFCGDGRLIAWFFDALGPALPDACWKVELWDLDPGTILEAKVNVLQAAQRSGAKVETRARAVDAFQFGTRLRRKFDLVLTNPPWELLKPDSRELARLPSPARGEYVSGLRSQDRFLTDQFPRSQPKRKFAGWGTNLSRAGVELSVNLLADSGIAGIVSPPSIFADDNSARLREWLFSRNVLLDAAYFPAELKLFPGADVAASTLVIKRAVLAEYEVKLTAYPQSGADPEAGVIRVCVDGLKKDGFIIPVSLGAAAADLLPLFDRFPRFSDLEKGGTKGLWAGREVDETRIGKWFRKSGAPFLKGRQIRPYSRPSLPAHRLDPARYQGLGSVDFERIVWRDVSRPSQKRRMQATIIPRDWVTGNSLHVAYFRNHDSERLRALLAIMNSFSFEFQIRAKLATGHLSLSVVRQARVPDLTERPFVRSLALLAERCLRGEDEALVEVEAKVAQGYGLSRKTFTRILRMFPRLTAPEKAAMLRPGLWPSAEARR